MALEPALAEGDRVLCAKNLEAAGRLAVRNGEMGRVLALRPGGGALVAYGTKLAEHPRSQLEYIQLAYAVSVHKFQGGEAPVVSVVVHPSHGEPLMRRCLLYTAVTRPRDRLVLYADASTLRRCAAAAERRRTCLAAWLGV